MDCQNLFCQITEQEEDVLTRKRRSKSLSSAKAINWFFFFRIRGGGDSNTSKIDKKLSNQNLVKVMDIYRSKDFYYLHFRESIFRHFLGECSSDRMWFFPTDRKFFSA